MDGDFLLLSALLAAGAAIQAAVGFGFPYLLAPVALFILPELIPGPILLLTLAINSEIAFRERGDVDFPAVGWITAGRVVGAVVAAAMFGAFNPDIFKLVLGSALLIAVLLTAGVGARMVRRNRGSLTGAGVAAGIMGTLTGVGAPPIALLYSGEEPSKVRSILSVSLLIGVVISLFMLWLFGHFGMAEVWLALSFLPATLIGVLGGRYLSRHINKSRARLAILVISAFAAIGLIGDVAVPYLLAMI
tara:strand:- start:1555 stop:2295 length:741 start_codon:yes stop_codon:yes gene_type:complete